MHTLQLKIYHREELYIMFFSFFYGFINSRAPPYKAKFLTKKMGGKI